MWHHVSYSSTRLSTDQRLGSRVTYYYERLLDKETKFLVYLNTSNEIQLIQLKWTLTHVRAIVLSRWNHDDRTHCSDPYECYNTIPYAQCHQVLVVLKRARPLYTSWDLIGYMCENHLWILVGLHVNFRNRKYESGP